MTRIDELEAKVRELYDSKNPNRADWADWLCREHVFIVADNATVLAERFNANVEYARAGAVLHDIADAVMSRFDDEHENTSLAIARQYLEECGFTVEEIALVVDDAIRYHSCHDGNQPKSLEGKVLATADALAHLTTNFYELASVALKDEMSPEQLKDWVLKKLDRDFYNKVLFSEVKQEVQPDYEHLKLQYSY